MNKTKENTSIKTIKLVSKETLNDIKKIKMKESFNSNITHNQIQQNKIRDLKIKERKYKEMSYKNKSKNEEEQKYFDFNAHFKYSELVDALNKLKSNKNESTSNTSNANLNINNNTSNANEKKNILKINNTKCNDINGVKLSKSKHKVISRNIQMNNYIKYLGYIEECKDNNLMLTSITNNLPKNKTSYFPQTELVKKRINNHLEELNELKHKILPNKNNKEIKRNDNKDKAIVKNNKINPNQKYNNYNNNLITISLINNNNKKKVIKSNNNENHNNNNINKNKNIYKASINNMNQQNKKIKKNNNIKMQNIKRTLNNKNNNNNPINKINKEESINNSKMQLKINNLLTNNNGNKFIKNKKIKNNIINFNCDYVGEKRKAHSSSLSKNKKNAINKINTLNHIVINNININNINNFNNVHINETNITKKQNTLNNIISSTNRIKPVITKSFQTNQVNLGSDNKNSKIKIITLNYVNLGKIRNKLNKKSINSFGSSLSKTKDIDKTKSKSNSKSNSKNKTSNGKLLI